MNNQNASHLDAIFEYCATSRGHTRGSLVAQSLEIGQLRVRDIGQRS